MSNLKALLEYYRDLGVKDLYRVPSTSASLEIPDMPKPPTKILTALPGLAPDNDTLELIRSDIGDCRR